MIYIHQEENIYYYLLIIIDFVTLAIINLNIMQEVKIITFNIFYPLE